MKDLILKKCNHCKAIVKIVNDCNCDCGFVCCGEKMVTIKANSVDASFEKHVPTYEVNDDEIVITVNHVMEDDHYIEWISAITEKEEITKYFNPGEKPKLKCKYEPNMKLYAYCNKHGLWMNEVE